MASGNQRDEILSDINVTPLVDVMLVLLVIMMVTASYVVTKSLNVNLPKAQSGSKRQAPLTLTIDKDGALWIEQTIYSEDALRGKLRTATAAGAELHALVAADGAVPHRQVVHVLDLLTQEHVTHVGIGVNPNKK